MGQKQGRVSEENTNVVLSAEDGGSGESEVEGEESGRGFGELGREWNLEDVPRRLICQRAPSLGEDL